MDKSASAISCIILAGGQGKRVGGVDKGLLEHKGKPLIEHVINTIAPQVDDIVISANRNAEYYKRYADKVIADESSHYLGPLAGIAAALPYCAHDWVLIVPCDTPCLPGNIINTFSSKTENRRLCIAESNGRLQLVMLLNKSLRASIKQALANGQLKLMQWAKSQHPETVVFSDKSAFKNFNHKEDFDT